MSSSEDEDDSDTLREDETNSQSIWQLLYFLLLWQSIFRISNIAMEVLLKSLSLLLNLFRKPVSDEKTNVSYNIPNTVPAAFKLLFRKIRMNL